MMNYIFAAMLMIAAIWGIFSGNGEAVSSAMLQSGISTAELMLTVTGGMVLWSGIMAIAEKSGLTDILAKFIRPLLRLIMPGLEKGSDAEKYVCMNISAKYHGEYSWTGQCRHSPRHPGYEGAVTSKGRLSG